MKPATAQAQLNYTQNNITLIDPIVQREIYLRHLEVSLLPTPKSFLELPKYEGGFIYVKAAYMKALADKHYPGWTLKLMSEPEIIDIVNKKGQQEPHVKIWGRLIWYESGIYRQGDMIMANNVSFLTEAKGGKVMDLGFDMSGTVTSLFRKAANFYLNICDDIYTWTHPDILPERREKLIQAAREFEPTTEQEKKIQEAVLANGFLLNSLNVDIAEKVLLK